MPVYRWHGVAVSELLAVALAAFTFAHACIRYKKDFRDSHFATPAMPSELSIASTAFSICQAMSGLIG